MTAQGNAGHMFHQAEAVLVRYLRPVHLGTRQAGIAEVRWKLVKIPCQNGLSTYCQNQMVCGSRRAIVVTGFMMG